MTASQQPTEALLGNAAPIVALRGQILRLAAFDTVGNPRVPTVLLVGETGTGKGLVARVIHDDPWTAASRWQRAIVDRIEGFGGHVVGQSHHRFVAVFGVPRALEQGTQRASHAAVAIQ